MSNRHIIIQAIFLPQCQDRLTKFCCECLVYTFVDKDSIGTDTSLAGISELRDDDTDRFIQIRISKNHEWRVASKLHRSLLDGACTLLKQDAPTSVDPVNDNFRTSEFCVSSDPISSAGPVMTLKTP